MTQQMIRVLIVDDHEMVRRGLAVFINSVEDISVAGEAANGQEAVAMIDETDTDVILMDLLMPVMGGVEAISTILQKRPDIRIIAMTSFEEEELVKDALASGAIGFLMKNASIEEITMAIRNAFEGKPFLAAEAAQILMNDANQPPAQKSPLTPRELEVLGLMAEGKTNPEIAEILTVSRSTIKTHVSSILSKLGLTSRVEVVRFALDNKMID